MLQPLFKTCALEQAAAIKLQHDNQHPRPLGVNLYKTRSQYKSPLSLRNSPFNRTSLIGRIGREPEVAIQMAIEPPPSRRKGRISHLYVYRRQIDEQYLNLNGG